MGCSSNWGSVASGLASLAFKMYIVDLLKKNNQLATHG